MAGGLDRHADTMLGILRIVGDAAILDCFIFLYFVFAGPWAFALDRAIWRRGAA